MGKIMAVRGQNLPTPLPIPAGPAFLFGEEKMRNSRLFHQEVRLNILHGEWIEAPDTTFDDMRSTALRSLGIDGLEDINSSGVIYRWSKLDRTGFAFPDEVIRDIASMFATAFTPYLQCCFCTHFKRWNSC